MQGQTLASETVELDYCSLTLTVDFLESIEVELTLEAYIFQLIKVPADSSHHCKKAGLITNEYQL